MGISPSRSSLYRRVVGVVIPLALVCALGQAVPAQTSKGSKPYQGPRALGLIEMPVNGKPRFIPIAILVNGDFYDASAYKASPVPMALWSETVYEGFRAGVSQGLFTVTMAQQNPKTNEWIVDGTWLPAGSIPARSAKKSQSSVPRGLNEDTGPPVLRHAGAKTPVPPEPTPTTPAPQTSQTADASKPPTPAPATPPTTTPAQHPAPPQTTQTSTAQTPSSAPAPTPSTASVEDPDAPVLHRGKPAPKPAEPLPPITAPAKAATIPAPAGAPLKPQETVQLIPAISDANILDARPYSFNMTSDEEQQFRKQMLALAADEIAARAKQFASHSGSSQPEHAPARRASARTAKPPQPDFLNVQLRVFDLSFSNEPVLVLSADAHMPKTASSAQNSSADMQYYITLVAREDINGDLHKAFTELTDEQHLDVLPRFELIDAVDADGDGRGELLFRQFSDAGTAFAIYRVIGNTLYPLFQGTP
jgi:hypothetical protein